MAEKYSAENGKTRVLPIQTSAVSADESEFVEVFTADPSSSSSLYRTKKVLMTEREARELDVKPRWIPVLEECSVECGGSKYTILTQNYKLLYRPLLLGWTNVSFVCHERGHQVETAQCDTASRPRMAQTYCNVEPCR